jgi:stage III sporulation protein AE
MSGQGGIAPQNLPEMDILGLIELDRYDTGILDRPGFPSFGQLIQDAVTGRLDLTPTGILSAFGDMLAGELFASGATLRQLVIIAILGALMSCLTQAFRHKSAGETGFYVTYLMAALLAISSFYIVVGVLNELVSLVSSAMQAAIPIMISVMAMGGNFLGAAAFHPLLFFALQALTVFISVFFIPLVLSAAALDIVGRLSPDDNKLEMLATFLRKSAGWTLKGVLATFMFLLTLQRFTAPILSSVSIQSARSLVGAVPVVGGAFTAAVDTVITFGQAARSGVLVALVLVVCAVLAAPLVKMLVISLIYRLCAAVLQPVAEPRLAMLMESVGRHMGMLFQAAALIGVMCIYTVVILLSF